MNINTTVNAMRKSAALRKVADGGIANDAIGSLASQVYLPYLGGLANMVGRVGGFVAGKPSEEDLKTMDEHPGRSYLPGVGGYRIMRKLLGATKNDKARRTMAADAFGGLTSMALPALGGALVGGATGAEDGAPIGAVIGGGSALAAHILGALIGTARKRRTEAEQIEADTAHSALKSLLIPGVAGYNMARRAAGIIRDEDKRNQKAEAEQKVANS